VVYVLPLNYNYIVNPSTSLQLIQHEILLSKYPQRGSIFNIKPSPFLFPSSLVADLVKKVFKKLNRDIVIALDGISSNKDIISREEEIKRSVYSQI